MTDLPLGPRPAANAVSTCSSYQRLTEEVLVNKDSYMALASTVLNTNGYTSVAYSLVNPTPGNTVTWRVVGALASDFSDAVEVHTAADVLAGNSDTFATSFAPYSYYRVEVKEKVKGSSATVMIFGLSKA